MAKKSTIQFEIELDDQNVPENIEWKASDREQSDEYSKAKAMLVSIFERDTKETLRFDIWTKEMQVQEMDRLMFYTLRGLADTYMRATQNTELANQFQEFATYFGSKTEILKPQDS
jgi:gliding motility-associated protein GldC